MPLPALLLAAAPYLASAAAGAAGGYLGKRLGGQSNAMPRQLSNNPNMMAQEYPGGTLGVRSPHFTGQQTSILDQLSQQGLGGMQNLPSSDFGPIRQAAMSQFNQDIMPGIAERFTAGGAGSQRSSAFQQASAGAGAGLAERLAAMEQGYNMQNRGQETNRLMSMLQMGLQPQFDTNFIPPGQSFGTSVAGGLGQGLGAASPLFVQMLMNYLGQGSSPSLTQ